jgi:sulfite exporter TauE/SafE
MMMMKRILIALSVLMCLWMCGSVVEINTLNNTPNNSKQLSKYNFFYSIVLDGQKSLSTTDN